MSHRPDLSLRVLHAIDLNARQSLASLSRALGPSREVLDRTIRDLEASGVVRGYITVLDIGRLGFMGIAVYARAETTDESRLSALLRFVGAEQDFYWSASLSGRFDLLLAIQARSLTHFADVLSNLQRKFPFLVDVQFAIRTRATQFQRQYLHKRSTHRSHGGFAADGESYNLSASEQRVLRVLIADPRASVVEIAERSKFSRVTVTAVMKRLEQIGVIQSYSALIKCQLLGYESYFVLVALRRFDQGVRSEIRRFAGREAGIIFCIETIGVWQTELHCEVRSLSELQQLLRRFRTEFAENVVSLEVVAAIEYYEHYRFHV